MEIYRNVRSIVERYVRREIVLKQLEDELAPLQPQLAKLQPDHPAAQLAGQADLLVAELSLGHRSEDEVRELLQEVLPLAATFAVPIARSQKNATASITYLVPGLQEPKPVLRVAADSETPANRRFSSVSV